MNSLSKISYYYAPTPEWITSHYTDSQIFELIRKRTVQEIPQNVIGYCYLFEEWYGTSNTKNIFYRSLVWDISNPQILQSASIQDFILNDNQSIVFHDISVIRNGVKIDKYNETTFRVLASEPDISFGILTQSKKVHCVIGDLRIGDIIKFTYSIVTLFQKHDTLSKKYYLCSLVQDKKFWFYQEYIQKVLNNRKEDIIIDTKALDDKEDTIIDLKALDSKEFFNLERKSLLSTGQIFEIKKANI